MTTLTATAAGDDRAAAVRSDAHPDLTGSQLASAWQDFEYAVTDEHGIRSGVLTWEAIQDDLACLDRTAAAIDIASERSKDALAVLTGRDGRQSL